MICPYCHTEIADNALICFRCGRATVEPKRRPPAPASSRFEQLAGVVTLALLVIAALTLGWVQSDQVPPALYYTVAALAAVALGLRFWARRRRGGR